MILIYSSTNYTLRICYWKKVTKITFFLTLSSEQNGEKNNVVFNSVMSKMIHLQYFDLCPSFNSRTLVGMLRHSGGLFMPHG
jgi:hypothetical protein